METFKGRWSHLFFRSSLSRQLIYVIIISFFFPTAQSWYSEKTWSLFLSVKYHFLEFSLYQFQLPPSAMDNLFYMLLLLSVTSTRLPMEHNLQLFFHSCPLHINLSPDLFHIRGNLLSLSCLLTVSHMPLLYKKLFESKIKWISHLLGKRVHHFKIHTHTHTHTHICI